MSVIEYLTNYSFIEWFFTLIVVFTCFLIFARTREFYQLSVKHRGIKYFRLVFFYFGLTYSVRLVSIIFQNFLSVKIFSFDLFTILFAIATYLSAITLFYILLMFFWEEIDHTIISNAFILHLVAMVFGVVSLLKDFPYFFGIFQVGIIIALAVMTIESKIKNRKENSLPMLFFLYSIVFGHWILINILQFLALFYPQFGIAINIITLLFLVALIWRLLVHIRRRK